MIRSNPSTYWLLTVLAAVAVHGPARAQTAAGVGAPVELGRVTWHRNFAQAAKMAKKTKKPRLLLFQEVPG